MKKGFTLVELLIAMAIMGIISSFSVKLLYDVVSSRSKQNAVENSSSVMRVVINEIRDSIAQADLLTISGSEIQIQGSPCRTIRYNASSKSVEQAIDTLSSCTPPTTNFMRMTDVNTSVNIFQLSSVNDASGHSKNVSITISGIYTDTINNHDFKFITSVTPRVTL